MGITSQQVKVFLGLAVVVLAYQNCSQHQLVIDEQLKSQTLTTKSLFADTTTDAASLAKQASFTFICPLAQEGILQPDLLHSEELKVVIEEYDYSTAATKVVCEVHEVRKQILDTRSVDLSSCESIPDEQNANLNLYIVPEDTKGQFEKHRLNVDTTPLALGGYTLNYLHLQKNETESRCDDSGDPLIVQLGGHDEPKLALTAPTDGILFDLLGQQSYLHAHDKVHTSWLKSSAGEIYFLVKPNNDKLVLGIDEMFADTTRGPDAKYSKQGFAALAKYDDNKDLLIDEEDVVFEELRLWKDLNLDGVVQENELFTLKEKKIKALDLRYETRFREVDSYGNQSRYKSVVVMEDQSYGVLLDLWLRFVHQAPAKIQAPAAGVSEAPAAHREPAMSSEPAAEVDMSIETSEEPVDAPAESPAADIH